MLILITLKWGSEENNGYGELKMKLEPRNSNPVTMEHPICKSIR